MPNICHKRRILFIHPTKCAGKSVEHAVFNFPKGGKSEHRKLQSYKKSLVDEYFVFSIVRNPWDRYISQLLFDKKNPKNLKEHLLGDLDPKNSNGMGLMHGRSLWSFKDSLTYDEKLAIDEVLRLENLDEDWKKVAGITGVKSLPKINVNPNRKHYSVYYNNETKDLLYQLWGWDADMFGYKFEKEEENG